MKSAYNRAPQQQQQNPKFTSKNHQVCIPIKLNLIIQLTNSKIDRQTYGQTKPNQSTN
jgi:hypothetical protein